LNDAEYRIIRRHPEKGQDILQPIALLKNHMHLIRSHHERWDGKGYPDGLAGDEIPVGAQIVSVVDAFDAMTSSRPYRKGMSRVLATAEIRRNMGVQFSGRVAEAFLAINESFAISEETTDITKK
jgi:HD-GYP domain-containing protein (c-di-GMP phosphodiesterase class II)